MNRALLWSGLVAIATLATQPALAKEFALERFFAGRTEAQGTFHAINGVNRAFKVDLSGRWDGRMLTLVEDFRFADGEKDRKVWRFEKLAPGSYRGTRDDVRGDTLVTINGDTATFSYIVDLDPGAGENLVGFNDTMVLRGDGTVLNTARVSKLGIPVAITRVEFRRR